MDEFTPVNDYPFMSDNTYCHRREEYLPKMASGTRSIMIMTDYSNSHLLYYTLSSFGYNIRSAQIDDKNQPMKYANSV